jgi:hypothetical protein
LKDGDIVLVEFLSDNIVIGTSKSTPHNFECENPVVGDRVITVRVTDSNGCITTSSPITITTNELVTELQSRNNVYSRVYPMPASDMLMVETNTNLVDANVKVVNVLDKMYFFQLI